MDAFDSSSSTSGVRTPDNSISNEISPAHDFAHAAVAFPDHASRCTALAFGSLFGAVVGALALVTMSVTGHLRAYKRYGRLTHR